MATVATKASASAYELSYLLTDTAAGGSVNIDAAGDGTPDLLTDSETGPLRDLLRSVIAAQPAARALAFANSALKIEIATRDVNALWIIDADTDGSSHLRLTLTAATADAAGTPLSIRYRHSLIR